MLPYIWKMTIKHISSFNLKYGWNKDEIYSCHFVIQTSWILQKFYMRRAKSDSKLGER